MSLGKFRMLLRSGTSAIRLSFLPPQTTSVLGLLWQRLCVRAYAHFYWAVIFVHLYGVHYVNWMCVYNLYNQIKVTCVSILSINHAYVWVILDRSDHFYICCSNFPVDEREPKSYLHSGTFLTSCPPPPRPSRSLVTSSTILRGPCARFVSLWCLPYLI